MKKGFIVGFLVAIAIVTLGVKYIGTPVDGPMKDKGHAVFNAIEHGIFVHANPEQMLIIEAAQANGNEVEVTGIYGINEYNLIAETVVEVATSTVKKCPSCGCELTD